MPSIIKFFWVILIVISTNALGESSNDTNSFTKGILTRTKLTGDWGGFRDDMAEKGVTLDFDATHVTQHVATGGYDGPVFSRLRPGENETESDAMFNMLFKLDTGKAGFWPGGFLTARGEARVGESIGLRAGGLMPSNGDAISPLVVGREREDVLVLSELNYAQFLSEQFGVALGLLNTMEGDSNEFAGSLRSRSHFMNAAMRYSPVASITVPATALGAMAIILPTKNIIGQMGVINSENSAGYNPFDRDEGTTFLTEWKFNYEIGGLSGSQTAGFTYGWDRGRFDIGTDPRFHVLSLANQGTAVQTNEDTWALYYNGHQYIQGDKNGGWGIFLRAGVSDGHPNPVKWNTAFGLGGTGVGSWRPNDNWGIGGYALGVSNEPVTNRLGLTDEVGFEAFYNVAVAPWLHLTADVQYIDSALSGITAQLPQFSTPGPKDSWVVGIRSNWNF